MNTEWQRRLRNEYLLNNAYHQGDYLGLDELEILKRFILTLLDSKDEAYQQELDKLMQSPSVPLLWLKDNNSNDKIGVNK